MLCNASRHQNLLLGSRTFETWGQTALSHPQEVLLLHASNIVHPLVNSSISCVKKLSYGTLQKPGLLAHSHIAFPADIRMIKVPHEYHSLQSYSFLHLSKEAFTYLVSLSRQPVVDAYHDITCGGLSFYLQALEWFVTCSKAKLHLPELIFC